MRRPYVTCCSVPREGVGRCLRVHSERGQLPTLVTQCDALFDSRLKDLQILILGVPQKNVQSNLSICGVRPASPAPNPFSCFVLEFDRISKEH